MVTTVAGVSMGTTAIGAAAATMSRPFKMTRIRKKNYVSTIFQQQHHHHLRRRQQNSELKLKFGESSSSSRIVNFGKVELGEIGRIRNFRQFHCKAIDQTQNVFQGVYGPWTIDTSDVREVILYRSGLVTAALSFVLASSAAFLPGNSLLSDILKQNLDLFYLLGSTGLGLSLFLIHIYVTEIKRTLQALWALGTVGSLVTYTALAQPAGEGLVQYVVDNPTAVWLVGPIFASLTGLVFKEGLCYGKLEAAVLTFIIPISLLGHLTGILDDAVKLSLLGVWMALFIIFAGRKFTQPVKDDIGDKSVFMFNALPEEEKAVLLEKLNQ